MVEPELYVDSTFVNQATTSDGWNGPTVTEVEVVSSSSDAGGASFPYEEWMGQEGEVEVEVLPSGNVEVVSDSEYSEYEQQFKSAQSGVMGDDLEEMEDKENPAADFVLRVLDAVFFVGEKVFFVLLPDLITGGARISSKYAQAMNRGRGTVGWRPLQNIAAPKR